MIPEGRLVRSLVASWALHAALALALWGWLVGGVEPPSLTILELVGPPDSGPGPSTASPLPAPARNRVAAARLPAGPPPPEAVPFAPEPAQVDLPAEHLAFHGAIRPTESSPPDVSASGGGAQGGPLTGPQVGSWMIPR